MTIENTEAWAESVLKEPITKAEWDIIYSANGPIVQGKRYRFINTGFETPVWRLLAGDPATGFFRIYREDTDQETDLFTGALHIIGFEEVTDESQ